mmetsp:Transcript_7731/g.10735  ORF Transcript_7731/g.10735 Transcript_7731/m.10735 type:complete len:142 (+) Transcript_7731:1635-2060(+)
MCEQIERLLDNKCARRGPPLLENGKLLLCPTHQCAFLPYFQFLVSFRSSGWLKLHGNRLQGEIPASLSDLSSLVRLTFHNNRLQGEVPSGFCDENIPTNTRSSIKNLTADCGGDPREIECSCCTLCVVETVPALPSRSDGT